MGDNSLMKYYIHVNQHIIRRNIHAEVPQPPTTIREGKHGESWTAMAVKVPDGSVVRYSHDKPILSCGARLVIECPTEPEILE